MINFDNIRKDFPILDSKVNGQNLIYFDNAATSQKPKKVIDSISDYYTNYNSNVHRGVHTLSMRATDAYEEARNKVAKLINAPTDCIIWTRNTTESLNLIATSWAINNISEDNNIIITNAEHHSNLVTWQQVSKKTGCELRFLDITDGFNINELKNIFDVNTSLISITHMSNVLGYVIPIGKITELISGTNTKIIVDGAQSVPHMPVDVSDLDIDFLTFSAHKMMGPTGIGVLYGKKELLLDMEPFLFGGDMIIEVSYDDAKWNQLPYKFEAGTPNIADAIATGVAADYLSNIGMENIWDHELELSKYALNKFSSYDKFTILGDNFSHLRGGVISFIHDKIHPHDIGTFLDQKGIAIRTGHHCAMPLIRSYDTSAAARISFYIYNTIEEIDSFFEALNEVEEYFS